MCTITEQKEAIITKEDITCYKKVEKYFNGGELIICSKYQNYTYELNKVLKAKITFQEGSERNFKCLDGVERRYFFDGSFSTKVKPEFKGEIKAIETGFHSALSEIRIRDYSCDLIVKCVIPKGSKVYYGATDLIVSNQLIVKELL